MTAMALKYHAVVRLLDDWEHDWSLWKSCPPTEEFLEVLQMCMPFNEIHK